MIYNFTISTMILSNNITTEICRNSRKVLKENNNKYSKEFKSELSKNKYYGISLFIPTNT